LRVDASPEEAEEPEEPTDLAGSRYSALFENLVQDAIARRASDVHLERYGRNVRVRIRVDGDLEDLRDVPLSTTDMRGVVNVVKIRADLDIAERRLPQGGRISMRGPRGPVDLRVQTQPSLHGEHIVVRILPKDRRMLALDDLGFPEALARKYRRLLDSPAGLVLVVGPTGSGKTTTLYAALQTLARDVTRKVITVEDPIEYSLDGVQQTQVHDSIGFTFDAAVRAFLREDPDVILVGEVRDPVTALEAIRASQTGHIVLSTLHCNDATDAIQRLRDLGIHPHSIAAELLAVIAQHLARRLCDACRQPAVPPPDLAAEVFPHGVPPGFRCFDAPGCARCDGKGTRGRIAVVEFLGVDQGLRDAIALRPSSGELRRDALARGLHTMRRSALEMVQQGILSLPELRHVLPLDRMAPEHQDEVT
jgi:type IV pilus assembly protein PilB